MSAVYDLIVIGGGSGGIAAANKAASFGARCIVIEANKLGGTCVNVGCVPKKIMWYASEIASMYGLGKDYGFISTNYEFDWQQLLKNRQTYIKRLNAIYAKKLQNNNVDIIHGRARFVANDTVTVGTQQFKAKHIIIACGGEPIIPKLPGAELGINSNDFFTLEYQPKKIAIVGAGYIAVELASMLQSLGSMTTLVLRFDRPLRHFDSMISSTLLQQLQNQGIKVCSYHVPTSLIKNKFGKLKLNCENNKVLDDYDCVLWAIGRRPVSYNLNLAAAGVKTNNHGYIIGDEFQNTNIPGIYSIGDVYGKVELTPVAIAAGRRLARRLFNNEKNLKLEYNNIPSVVFTHPPIGTIGFTEEQAVEKYGRNNIKVYHSIFNAMITALSESKSPTAMKMITLGPEEQIIGCHIIGTNADEMLQGFSVAITMGARKSDFDNTVAIHPTNAEELVTIK